MIHKCQNLSPRYHYFQILWSDFLKGPGYLTLMKVVESEVTEISLSWKSRCCCTRSQNQQLLLLQRHTLHLRDLKGSLFYSNQFESVSHCVPDSLPIRTLLPCSGNLCHYQWLTRGETGAKVVLTNFKLTTTAEIESHTCHSHLQFDVACLASGSEVGSIA